MGTLDGGVCVSEEQPSLGQLIWLVRRELEWAYAADADNPLRFDVGPVELETTVEATRATTGGGGLDLKVLGVGASGELSRESTRGTTSRVHVTLTPVDTRTGSRKYQISARDTEPPPRRADVAGEDACRAGAAWGGARSRAKVRGGQRPILSRCPAREPWRRVRGRDGRGCRGRAGRAAAGEGARG